LLEKESKKYSELKVKVAKLKSVFEKTPKPKPEAENESKFILISEKRIIHSVGESIDKAARTVDLVLSRPRLSKGFILFSEKMEKSCSRGVTWRFITETPSKEKLFLNQIRTIREQPHCQIKFLPAIPPTIIGIYDKQEVFIFKDPSEGISKSPALWSDNRSLLAIVADYFEVLWITAMEDENQKLAD
jgi:sugar-specific transcriptional regulator TrmB